MPSVERPPTLGSLVTGSPTKDRSASMDVTDGPLSSDQVHLPAADQTTARLTAVDGDDDIAAAAPTSWSFAACQRSECARIARIFRYARQRLRQELRGLALSHAELLLGAVTRMVGPVVETNEGRRALGAESPKGKAKGEIGENRPQEEHAGTNPDGEEAGRDEEERPALQLEPPQHIRGEEGEGGEEGEEGEEDGNKLGLEKSMYNARRGRNLRYEARPNDTWNKRWALFVDEEDMGNLSTLALESSMLKLATGAGTEAEAEEEAGLIVEWRKAFRKSVSLAGGSRHPIEPSVAPRCGVKRFLDCSTTHVNTLCGYDVHFSRPASSA